MDHPEDLLLYGTGSYRGFGDLVDDDDAEEDQDAKADPLYTVDLQVGHTRSLVMSFCNYTKWPDLPVHNLFKDFH